MSYAKEKLYEAMYCLVGDGPLRIRLSGAALYLNRLGPDDFPDVQAKEKFENLYHDLTHVEAGPGDDGKIDATTKRLTDGEAHRIGREILSLFVELSGGL